LPLSGASLTEKILAAHPGVHASGERSDLMKLMNRLCGSPLSPQGLLRLAALDRAELSEAANKHLREWRTQADSRPIIVDKMPGNALHLGFIATVFPGARILRCRRDLRDIGLSIYQLRFFGYHPYGRWR
jgi:galactose-1-phosphate uridylyltransferase